MQLYVFIGAALMALLAMLLPALAHRQHWSVIREDWRYPLRLALGVLNEDLGVAITYCWPGNGGGGVGGATPPTAVAAAQVPVQTAQVFFADTDTQAVVVHNKGLQASFPAFLYPVVVITKSLGGAVDTSFATNFTIGKALTNSVTINKLSIGPGSGGTYDVALIFGQGPWLK
jgi:hypothetical protein